MILAAGLLSLLALVGPPEPAERAYEDGLAAIDSGDLSAAEAHFRTAVELDPDHLRAWIRLATVVSWGERHKEAIALYDRALEIAPTDYDARLGLAKVTSWAREYDRSIETYEGLLNERPADRTLRLGLASVSSWARRYPRSIEIYQAMLAEDPADQEARLGLARVSSWAGRLEESEAAYRTLLERAPQDVEARNGLAAVLSWDRQLDDSLALYEGTLEIEPDNADAQAGRARVLWWQGRRERGWAALGEAERAHPGNDTLEELSASIRSGMAPVATASAGVMHDSDKNAIDFQTAAFSFTPTVSTTAGATYRRFDATQPFGTGPRLAARLESLSAQGSVRPGEDLLLTGSVGAEKITRDRAEANAHATASAGISYRLSDEWTFGGSLAHQTFAATALSLHRDVWLTSVSGSADYLPFSSLSSRFSLERAYLKYGNQRDQISAAVRWSTPLKRPKVWLTWLERYFTYANDAQGAGQDGYFSPDSYWAHIAGVEAADNFTPRSGWRVDASLGTQRVDTSSSAEPTSDTVRGYGLAAWYEVWPGLTLEAYHARTNLAIAAGGGLGTSGSDAYKSTESGLRLTWRIEGLHIGAYRDDRAPDDAGPRASNGARPAMEGTRDE